MSLHTSSRLLRPALHAAPGDVVCLFRAPAAHCPRAFSTSPPLWKKDNNSNRGRSAVRATGLRPRQTLSVKQKDFENQKLPKPVKIEGGGPDSIDEWCRRTREQAINESEKRALAAQDSLAQDPASQEPPLRDSELSRESEDVVMETE